MRDTICDMARPYNIMAKPAGAQCNLDCRYCFYVPKSALYAEQRPRMSDEVLAAYVKQMLNSQPGPEVSFAWQGGEPTLMGLPFYSRVVEAQKQFARPGVVLRNALQTNGTLLDDEWCGNNNDGLYPPERQWVQDNVRLERVCQLGS